MSISSRSKRRARGEIERLPSGSLRVRVYDDLYELISDRAQHGRSLITTSNRSPVDWYTPFPNPIVAESLLDRLINTSHQIVMNDPSYRPNKRPGRAGSTSTPATK